MKPQDGMTISSDPKSTDQYKLTQQLLAENRNIRLIKVTYVSSRALFLEYKIDCLVYTKDETLSAKGAYFHPLEAAKDPDLKIPAVITLRDNYAIKRILSIFLDKDKISCIQRQVINEEIQPLYL